MTDAQKLQQLALAEKKIAQLSKDIDTMGMCKVLKKYGPKHSVWHAPAKVKHLKQELGIS